MNNRSRNHKPKSHKTSPAQSPNGEIVIDVKLSGCDEAEPIYANHTTVNINPFESTLIFAYVDGLKVASVAEGKSRMLEAKTRARVVLPHRALLDLYRAIGGLIKRVSADAAKGNVAPEGEEQP